VMWLAPEEYSRDARRLRQTEAQMLAPAHFRPEVANALWTKGRKGLLSRDEARRMLALDLPVEEVSTLPLLPAAFDIAARFERTVYDALYVALALREHCQLVTADKKLRNALAKAFPATILWVEDIPA
jgi:predicted nucleic acid-binding protein